jgi:hypothetical protein
LISNEYSYVGFEFSKINSLQEIKAQLEANVSSAKGSLLLSTVIASGLGLSKFISVQHRDDTGNGSSLWNVG